MQLDQLKDAYSKHLGHKCAIERFLVVGEGGFTSGCEEDPIVGLPPWNVGCDVDPVEMTMPRMVELCGQTRLWAGLHFEDSMSAGEELCEGIGLAAMDHVKALRLGSKPDAKLGPWPNGHGLGGPRPDGCPEGPLFPLGDEEGGDLPEVEEAEGVVDGPTKAEKKAPSHKNKVANAAKEPSLLDALGISHYLPSMPTIFGGELDDAASLEESPYGAEAEDPNAWF